MASSMKAKREENANLAINKNGWADQPVKGIKPATNLAKSLSQVLKVDACRSLETITLF